jgi:hypothetical protein
VGFNTCLAHGTEFVPLVRSGHGCALAVDGEVADGKDYLRQIGCEGHERCVARPVAEDDVGGCAPAAVDALVG